MELYRGLDIEVRFERKASHAATRFPSLPPETQATCACTRTNRYTCIDTRICRVSNLALQPRPQGPHPGQRRPQLGLGPGRIHGRRPHAAGLGLGAERGAREPPDGLEGGRGVSQAG